MTKLQTLLSNVNDIDKEESHDYPLFESEFGIYDICMNKFKERVSEAQLLNWIDGDTLVGLTAYYFDNELIAVSSQAFRRDDTSLHWVNEDTFTTMKAWCASITNNMNIPTYLNGIDDDTITLLEQRKSLSRKGYR